MHNNDDGTECPGADRRCATHFGPYGQLLRTRAQREPEQPRPRKERPAGALEEKRRTLSDMLDAHDLRAVSWQVAGEVVQGGPEEARRGSAFAAVARIILALPPENEFAEDELEEVAVIGGIHHGVPPQNEREWEIAHKFFDDHTLQMMGEWKPEDGWLTWMSGKGLPWDPDDEPAAAG